MEPEIESWQSEKESVEREIHGSPGQRSDPKKILAILQMPEPKDIAALKRFLGMVTYLAKFMHHYQRWQSHSDDESKQVTVQRDALGAVLLQNGQPVQSCYASWALAGTESRYSKIEEEMLPITCQYLYERDE